MRASKRPEQVEHTEARTALEEIRQRLAEVQRKARLDALEKRTEVLSRGRG